MLKFPKYIFKFLGIEKLSLTLPSKINISMGNSGLLCDNLIVDIARVIKTNLINCESLNERTVTADIKFPKFNKDEFKKDFETWKTINHLNKMGRPKRPERPILRKSFDEQLKDIPEAPHHPYRPSMVRAPKPVKPEDRRENYTTGQFKKDFEIRACPRPNKPISEYKFEGRLINYRILREFDYNFRSYLSRSPEILFKEYNEILEHIRKYEPEDSYFIINELSEYYKKLKTFVEKEDRYLQEYADRIYKEELDEYERKLAEWKEDTLEKRQREYSEKLRQYYKDLETYEKQKEEFKLNNRGNTDIELYLDALQDYEDKVYQYEEKMRRWGPVRNLVVDDFLLLMYVRPEVNGNSVFLKNGREYVFPEYVRGVKSVDLKNISAWGDHLESYRKFLRMNPSISKETPGKYDIRSTDSKWTFNNFIRAWVLNYYTDFYEDIEILED